MTTNLIDALTIPQCLQLLDEHRFGRLAYPSGGDGASSSGGINTSTSPSIGREESSNKMPITSSGCVPAYIEANIPP